MKLRSSVSDAVTEVRTTAEAIGESARWNTTALVAVTVVSVVALIVATTALVKVNR